MKCYEGGPSLLWRNARTVWQAGFSTIQRMRTSLRMQCLLDGADLSCIPGITPEETGTNHMTVYG